MRREILSVIWPAALLLALGGIPQPGSPATDPKPAHAKKTDSFLTGDPFTLEQVLLLLKQDAIPLRRRKEAIENRGVAFALSSDALAKLESAGATDEILDVIKSKAKAAPVPPVAPAGRLIRASLLRQQLLHGLLGSLEILGQEICLLPRGLSFLLVAAFIQRPRQQ